MRLRAIIIVKGNRGESQGFGAGQEFQQIFPDTDQFEEVQQV
jgi:hypothetical protein